MPISFDTVFQQIRTRLTHFAMTWGCKIELCVNMRYVNRVDFFETARMGRWRIKAGISLNHARDRLISGKRCRSCDHWSALVVLDLLPFLLALVNFPSAAFIHIGFFFAWLCPKLAVTTQARRFRLGIASSSDNGPQWLQLGCTERLVGQLGKGRWGHVWY